MRHCVRHDDALSDRGRDSYNPTVAPAQAGAQWLDCPRSLKDAGFPPARE
ncbi:hypothetical protein GP5015_147 [gamma proteobacterium HTCC5015]|nr:hypothetical protein GP5015_147 [gamma proteobacterium HTCC5015]